MFANHPTIARKWAEEGKANVAGYKPVKRVAKKATSSKGGAVKVSAGKGMAKGLVAMAGGRKSAAAKKAVKRTPKKY